MNDNDIRSGIVAVIQDVAPEVEADELVTDRPLREQVDLDSMDWLNVIVGFHERFGVDIPEADYAKLTTIDAIAAYIIAARAG